MRITIRRTFYFSTFWLLINLVACGSNPPAPVIDRLPASKSSTQKNSVATRPTYKAGDWRPDTYVVKKGDNLFSIGLEHGYYYKDIAQANNIVAPYNIRVGQILKFKPLKDKVITAEIKPDQQNKIGDIVITPINTESTTTTITSSTQAVIAITEPKAIREPYTEDALKKPLPIAKPITEKPITFATASKPAITTTSEATNKPSIDIKPETKTEQKSETKPNAESSEDIDWAWPTKGKVIANFNEAGNKGVDISGSAGQNINAAASGKVIYSGSDLRGYGKLVIIKHNSTYLSVYAHNSLIVVKEGQQISRGQKIAEMGNSDSNSVKLHFEIRRQGKSVDPTKYLAAN
ncbi:MAG: peptidoglycan DD-metalloendopeptidase family protein [Methylotenera sp.]|nr:peptidoglycan DD-metalloendopeptidase family protein [Methylotenera sp.]